MRDKKRIKPFLERLGNVWEENASDWRFRATYGKYISFNGARPIFP